tara:strand:- start:2009 stop:3217 length:1209 start_codon:yes stop_codon:yes gene_type:complete
MKLDHLVTDKNKWLFIHQDIARSLAARNEDLEVIRNEKRISPKIILLYALGFIKLIFLFLNQSFKKNNINISKYDHIFLSTQDKYDSRKYEELHSKRNLESIVLNAFDVQSYSKILKVNFSLLFYFYKEAVNQAQDILKYSSEDDFIRNNIPKSLHALAHYSFFCGFMKTLSLENRKISIFHSGATLSATAALNCGIKTNYLTHGLIGKTSKISFPNFDNVYVYSKEEKDHLERYAKKISIYASDEINSHNKKLIIFLRKFDRHMSQSSLSDIISYCKDKKYEVILKPHPSYQGVLCSEIAQSLNVRVLEKKLTASELLRIESPAITAGWLSTALCESLTYGCLPISLADFNKVDDGHSWSPIVYPFEKRTFSWVNENKKTREVIVEFNLLKENIEFLRNRN